MYRSASSLNIRSLLLLKYAVFTKKAHTSLARKFAPFESRTLSIHEHKRNVSRGTEDVDIPAKYRGLSSQSDGGGNLRSRIRRENPTSAPFRDC